MSELIRKDVFTALLKHHDARALAKLKNCPLCGFRIGENVWTIINYSNFDQIGLAGVQCSNEGCLLHRGIVYEGEAERLRVWQAKNKEEK